MKNGARLLAVIAFVPLAASGCGGCEIVTTPGELGVAQFEWGGCDHIMEGSCPILEAIAAGATTSIHVYNGVELPPYEVRSSAPDLAVFIPMGDHLVRVETARAGEVALELYAVADGALIDRLRLRVADVAAIAMIRPVESPPLALTQGGDLELAFRTHESGGALLVGSGAVSFDTAGGLSIVSRSEPGEREERVVVRADTPGRATLSARAGAAALDLPVLVVTPNDVAEARIVDPVTELSSPAEGGTYWILAEAYLRDGKLVHRPRCVWTSSDPGCVSTSGETQSLPDGCSARLDRLRARCRADITVAIGAFASDTVRVQVR